MVSTMAAKNEEDLVELLEYRLQVFEHKLSNVILLNEELLRRNEELKNELSEKSQINNTLLGKLRVISIDPLQCWIHTLISLFY